MPQDRSRAGLHYTDGQRKAAVEHIDEEKKGERAKRASAQEDRVAARQKAEQVAVKLKEMKLADAAELVRTGIEETLYYYAFPREHWRSLRTNNPLERILREVRRRGFAREHPDPAIAGTRSGASGRGRNGGQSPQL